MNRLIGFLMGAAILTASFTATAQQLERDVGVVSAEVAGQQQRGAGERMPGAAGDFGTDHSLHDCKGFRAG